MSDEGEVEVIEEDIVEEENVDVAAEDSQKAPDDGTAEEKVGKEEIEVGQPVEALASNLAAAAAEEAFIEVPMTTEEPNPTHDDEKTEDQITEIEEDKQNMGARQASLDEFRDIPVDKEEETSAVEEEVAAPEPEPPAEEAAPVPEEKESSPVTRKKVTIEESPPASPVKKEGSTSPTRKEPSWRKKGQKSEEEEVVEAESIEELKSEKSESRSAPAPAPEPAPAPAPALEPEPEPEPTPQAAPEPEPVQEEPAAPVEEAKEESVHEEAPKAAEPEESFIEVPVTVDEPETAPVAEEKVEESQVTLEPAEEEQKPQPEPEPVEERKREPAASPPRQSRRDRAEAEERPSRATTTAAPVDTSYSTPTPIARTPTYVTYSSWAPASDYRSSYIPTYSSYVRPSRYYQSPTSYSNYSRPTSQYVRNFDNYVRTGAFGQSSYATDRLRTRSRSRDRSGYTPAGYYTVPQLRTSRRDYSLPSRFSSASGPPSAAPSRSGSFVNFMDYIVTTDRNLRRSTSRSSSIGEDYAPLSRSSSRTILPAPVDTINHWYDKQISHVNNYVSRLNSVYDHNNLGYYSRYNTSRPYIGYVTSGFADRSTYSRSLRGHSSDLEQRLSTHKTYLRAYDLTKLPTTTRMSAMTRSIFY